MASLVVGPSLQALPNRIGIGRASPAPRPSISTAHAAKAATTVSLKSLVSSDKPLISGGGISCNVQLTEPNVYLTGFDPEGRPSDHASTAALIRGRLIVNVQKAAKIKSITLRFFGKARTEWPEGIPPEKNQYYEEEKLRYQVLPFFNAQYPGAESGYGAQCKYVLRNKDASGVNTNVTTAEIRNTPRTPQATMSSRDQRRLSLGNVQARSFNRSEPSLQVIQQKGYKTFHPGVYEYYFEITMDHKSPETINLPMGGVKWMFDALIERSGTFKPNLHGVQELTVVRAPDPNSLTEVEPIAITRKWEDQLHYEIVISGKSFPLGGKIPIALKLTPLAKVQCHRVRFFVTENVEYYCRNKKVTRKDVQRKLLLFEKLAHQPLAPEYTGSTFKSIAGGEKTARERDLARQTAENCRKREAERNGTKYTPLPPQADNILGDLELGLDHLNIQSEIEMEVQLPTCARMKSDKTYLMHPDTSYPNIRVHHWLKIVLRLSKTDPEDSSKRRHFEISIDSPFHLVSCLATHRHTSLPSYAAEMDGPQMLFKCGCPNAAPTGESISPDSSTSTIGSDGAVGPDAAAIPDIGLTVPAQAHTAHDGARPEGPGARPAGAASSAAVRARPMHLLRQPSYNPPAFDADDPPPPMQTPPPLYDHVIGTPSVDGLADYFARLANEYDDEDEDDEDDHRVVTRGGAVNVRNPMTPGGRNTSRSMDLGRSTASNSFTFRPESFDPRLTRERASEDTDSERSGTSTPQNG